MTTAPPEPAAVGAALEAVDAGALDRAPVMDQLHPRQVELLKALNPGLKPEDLAHGLELAWAYQLDPYAKEIWFTRSRGRNGGEGKLLVMVGRDGLRKIAQRNGLHVDGDVVRANDTFSVRRTPDGQREVLHEYGAPAERGEIVAAWCEVRKGGPKGTPEGFAVCYLSEYRPGTVDAYSPWGKQTSVMILSAAERTAIRQATPLGGLIAAGEEAAALESGTEPEGDPLELVPLGDEVRATVERATRLGHVGYSDVATTQMVLAGQDEAFARRWLDRINGELDVLEDEQRPVPDAQRPVPDAQVVEPEPVEPEPTLEAPAPEEGVEALRERALDLLDQADAAEAAEDHERAEELRGEAEQLRVQVEAAEDPAQEAMDL